MNIVMLLIPLMLMLVALGIVLFSWAVKSGQYDDLDGPAHRILHDDDKDMIPTEARPPSERSAKDRQSKSDSGKSSERSD
ncbi:cbb3-type cytochrome oxidase assembly protein CcoS [Marinobacter litoralis]|uniref:cbb3-type cytochrome oxidase assembly protein CcoS n=1 Tax=Marinobacter litoralis TaxID=187981 RepID=UPI0018EA4B24|nr:cbb3-type cytochrome oxidase assembly protein CcoS [Marinobacter litoralis]MBJ6137570.1 cbb3-type cytochrome oxidase assembly protein CcoS [Marinobacter litoralis]